VNHIPSCKECS